MVMTAAQSGVGAAPPGTSSLGCVSATAVLRRCRSASASASLAVAPRTGPQSVLDRRGDRERGGRPLEQADGPSGRLTGSGSLPAELAPTRSPCCHERSGGAARAAHFRGRARSIGTRAVRAPPATSSRTREVASGRRPRGGATPGNGPTRVSPEQLRCALCAGATRAGTARASASRRYGCTCCWRTVRRAVHPHEVAGRRWRPRERRRGVSLPKAEPLVEPGP
jgi:hypothetical protein